MDFLEMYLEGEKEGTVREAGASADVCLLEKWSFNNLPKTEELHALGLVGPGLFANVDEIQSLLKVGVGVCRTTGVLVCIAGEPRLAARPSSQSGLANRVWRKTGKAIGKRQMQEAEALGAKIAARLPENVKIQQRDLLYSLTGQGDGKSAPVTVAPLAWGEDADHRFACGECPSTASSRKDFLTHLGTHGGNPGSKAETAKKSLLQGVFIGTNTVYAHVRAAGSAGSEDAQIGAPDGMSSPRALTVVQSEPVRSLAKHDMTRGAGGASSSRKDRMEEETTFLFKSGLMEAMRRLEISAESACFLAKEPAPKLQADSLSMSPMCRLEKAVISACEEMYASLRLANPSLKAACLWRPQGSGSDDAVESAWVQPVGKTETEKGDIRVIVRLVSFIARMISIPENGAVTPEVKETGWAEDHREIVSSITELFRQCQRDQAIEENAHPEHLKGSVSASSEVLLAAHRVLFNILVVPVPLVRKSVSPLFAFLAASAATRKEVKDRRGDSTDYSWSPWSKNITPLAAAILKTATAVSVHHILDETLLVMPPNDRVKKVQRFRQEAHLDGTAAPVAEVAVVQSLGKRTSASEHGKPTVDPCPVSEHGICAHIEGQEIPLLEIGSFAKKARKIFQAAFKEIFLGEGETEFSASFDNAWLDVPHTGADTLQETEEPWMTVMGPEQQELASQARNWVFATAVSNLKIESVEGNSVAMVARNRRAVAKVCNALRICARALMTMCTLGTGAPLRSTETASTNLQGSGGVVRDVYFLDGAFFLIHHAPKTSHNFATGGDLQPRKLPAEASASIAAWCRMCLPLRDLLLQCGETVLGMSTKTDPSTSKLKRLIGDEDITEKWLNTGLEESGFPLTISFYRQYAAYMLREVTRAGTSTEGNAELYNIAMLVAAAEQKFDHSEESSRDHYGRGFREETTLLRRLPSYGAVSTLWHHATGQESVDQGNNTPPHNNSAGIQYQHKVGAGGAPLVCSATTRKRALETAARNNFPKRHTTQGHSSTQHDLAHASCAGAPSPGSLSPIQARMLLLSAAHVLRISVSEFSWSSTQQEQATHYVASGMQRGDALLVLPTRGGKFLTYAAPCIWHPERLCVVIVPFVSLAHDLEQRFRHCGVRTARFADLSRDTLGAGCPEIVVVIAGLEAVSSNTWALLFAGAFGSGRDPFIVVEECHVLLYDRYRAAAVKFAGAVRKFAAIGFYNALLYTTPPMLLVTATAPPASVAEIFNACGSDVERAPTVFRVPCTIRPNLLLTVTTASNDTFAPGMDMSPWISSQVQKALDMRQATFARSGNHVALVFVETGAMAKDVTASLQGLFADVLLYHTKMTSAEKEATFKSLSTAHNTAPSTDIGLLSGAARLKNVTVVVATVALGVELEISNVCTVCILGHRTPSSVAAYAGMAGRAGQDGLPSLCATLLHPGAPLCSFGDVLPPKISEHTSLQAPLSDPYTVQDVGKVSDSGEFAQFCTDNTVCRQARLYTLLDNPRESGGTPGLVASANTCMSLRDRFFPHHEFQACDVCKPDVDIHGEGGADAYETHREEFDVLSVGAGTLKNRRGLDLSRDDTTPSQKAVNEIVAELDSDLNQGSEAQPSAAIQNSILATPGMAPLPHVAAGSRPSPSLDKGVVSQQVVRRSLTARDLTHAIKISTGDAFTSKGPPKVGASGSELNARVNATSRDACEQIERIDEFPAVAESAKRAPAYVPIALSSSAGVLQESARERFAPTSVMPVHNMANIVKAAPSSERAKREKQRNLIDQVLSLCSSLRSANIGEEACVQCISDVMSVAIMFEEPVAPGGPPPTWWGPGPLQACTHTREGCLNCAQSWRHIEGAVNSLAEHGSNSPRCPLKTSRRTRGRCSHCWMGTVYGLRHEWGGRCPFSSVRNAALRMFWDNTPSTTAFVSQEARRTGRVQGDISKISTCLATFAKFLVHDDPVHGPPLAQLVIISHAYMQS